MRTKSLLPAIAILCLVCSTAKAQNAPSYEPPSYPSLHIGGFTDFDFFASDKAGKDPKSGFSEGQFVLHFTSLLAPRLGFFGEVSSTSKSGSFNIVIERAIIRWDENDQFKLSFGRYHTPINYWNTAFHHGQWLQTSVSRPEMTKFGGKFIPVHFVGGLIEGSAAAGGLNLGYKVGIGNGRFSDISGAGDAGDVNSNRAYLGGLTVRPDALYDLQMGATYYHDLLTLTGNKEFGERIFSAHVVWTRETPEFIAEYAKVKHHEMATGNDYDSDAWYVQLAYRLPIFDQKVKPYVRYEKIDTPAGDLVYADVKDFEMSLGGIRYDFTDTLAVKLEYRRQKIANDKPVKSLWAQICYAF